MSSTDTEVKGSGDVAEASAEANSIPESFQNIKKKFEVEVFDVSEEADGKSIIKRAQYNGPVYVEATSPADLKEKLQLFKQCGQIAKILREVPTSNQSVVQKPIQQPKPHPQMQQPQAVHQVPVQQAVLQQIVPVAEAPRKPRYFKVGDIDVKDDNGKIYQKQWMKLSDAEASNIRVINDKNNGIVNLAGKHIEMKKWVLIESDSTPDELESCLEG